MKIPKTALIHLEEFEQDQWDELSSGVIRQCEITGYIEDIDNPEEDDIYVSIIIDKVIDSDDIFDEPDKDFIKKIDADPIALENIFNHFLVMLKEYNWVLSGYINSPEKIPIILVYNEVLEKCVYSTSFKNIKRRKVLMMKMRFLKYHDLSYTDDPSLN